MPEDLDAALDAIAAPTPEQIEAEMEKLKTQTHLTEQEDVRRRISTPATQLMREEPDKRQVFFRPVRPPMVPLSKANVPSVPVENTAQVEDELPVGCRRAKLLYSTDVPDQVRVGVIKRWNNQLSMVQILRWANDIMRRHQRPALEAIDIFAIADHELTIQSLKHLATEDAAPSRTDPVVERLLQNEMNLTQFRAFIFQWKRGGKFKECMAAAGFTNEYFGQLRYKELGQRWRADALFQERQDHKKTTNVTPWLTDKIMRQAMRCRFNGLQHLVIPFSALPNEVLKEMDKIPLYRAPKAPPPDPETVMPPAYSPGRKVDANDAIGLLEELDSIAAEQPEPPERIYPTQLPASQPIDEPNVPIHPTSATDEIVFDDE